MHRPNDCNKYIEEVTKCEILISRRERDFQGLAANTNLKLALQKPSIQNTSHHGICRLSLAANKAVRFTID